MDFWLYILNVYDSMMILTWGWEVWRRGVGRLVSLPETASLVRTIFVVPEATLILTISIIIIFIIIIIFSIIIINMIITTCGPINSPGQ